MPQIQGHPHIVKKILNLKAHIKPHTLVVGDFNTPFSALGRSTRHKLNRETRELTEVMTQMYLKDIYRLFHLNIKAHTFFLAPHRTLSKIDHILGNKNWTHTQQIQKIGLIPSILSDYYDLKLEFYNNTNWRKPAISWKLNNVQLNHHSLKAKIKKEIKDNWELNKNENTTYPTYWTLWKWC